MPRSLYDYEGFYRKKLFRENILYGCETFQSREILNLIKKLSSILRPLDFVWNVLPTVYVTSNLIKKVRNFEMNSSILYIILYPVVCRVL